MIKYFEENKTGKDFVVGDIHGCFHLLDNELKKINFDEENDRLFSVGDLVDRGPHSEDVLLWLNKPFFHAVLGNHEQMTIDSYNSGDHHYVHLQNGGAWFFGLTECEQKEIAYAFEKLPVAIEIKTNFGNVGIVHADVTNRSWNDFKRDIKFLKTSAIWGRVRINEKSCMNVNDVHSIYVGHTPVYDHLILGNVNYIDTGAVFNEKLTLVEIVEN